MTSSALSPSVKAVIAGELVSAKTVFTRSTTRNVSCTEVSYCRMLCRGFWVAGFFLSLRIIKLRFCTAPRSFTQRPIGSRRSYPYNCSFGLVAPIPCTLSYLVKSSNADIVRIRISFVLSVFRASLFFTNRGCSSYLLL